MTQTARRLGSSLNGSDVPAPGFALAVDVDADDVPELVGDEIRDVPVYGEGCGC